MNASDRPLNIARLVRRTDKIVRARPVDIDRLLRDTQSLLLSERPEISLPTGTCSVVVVRGVSRRIERSRLQ